MSASIGEINISNTGHKGEIIVIKNAKDIDVLIDDAFMLKNIQYGNFIRGRFESPYQPSICNFGYIGVGKYKSKNGTIHTPQYRKWHDMIERCYNKKLWVKHPSYKIISVCDEWRDYQNFARWYDDNYIKIDDELHLDKDILVQNNKTYSPHTCCLIPRRINMILHSYETSCDKLPLGVTKPKNGNQYKATMYKVEEGTVYCGSFYTQEEAFEAYKTTKERYIKQIADEYKYILPEKVYTALFNFEIKPYPKLEMEVKDE